MRVSQNHPKESSLLIVLTLDLCHSKYYRENVQQRRVYIYIRELVVFYTNGANL